MSTTVNTFADFNRLLIADLRANGGHATSGPFVGRDVLILTTTGARSGEARENPLAFTREGKDVFVIASKGGAPAHPSWYHNLVTNPIVTVEVEGDRYQAWARVTEGEERTRLYAKQAERMPAFRDYERKTERQIPVVVLERLN